MDVGVAGPGLSCSLASVVVLLQLQSARNCGAADRVSIVGFLRVPSFASLRSSLSCVTRAMCGREPRPAEVVVSLLGTIFPPYVSWLYIDDGSNSSKYYTSSLATVFVMSLVHNLKTMQRFLSKVLI